MTSMESMPRAEVVMMTPQMAAEWLQKNTENRPLDVKHVRRLADRITQGEYELNNDAIAFDLAGMMQNGQHRLHAIIEANATVPVLVIWNLAVRAKLTMDEGRKRSPQEQFGFYGIAGGKPKASLCRAILVYDPEKGLPTTGTHASNLEVINWSLSDELMDDALLLTNSLARNLPGTRTTAFALGYYLILSAWPEKVPAFHEMLSDGVGLTINSPIRRLRNTLTRRLPQNSGVERRKVLAMFLKTFNSWIDDSEVEVLSWRSNENWPHPYTEQSYKRVLALRERAARSAATRKARATS